MKGTRILIRTPGLSLTTDLSPDEARRGAGSLPNRAAVEAVDGGAADGEMPTLLLSGSTRRCSDVRERAGKSTIT
jgi:hypothetical protein